MASIRVDHTLSFWAWLKQQIDRDDPVGDLARDAVEDYRRGYKGVRSIGGLRNRMRSVGACNSAERALDEALAEWRETKAPLSTEVVALLQHWRLVIQDQPYPDRTVRIAREDQRTNINPHPRAYLPLGCSLSEALRLLEEGGLVPQPPAQLAADIANAIRCLSDQTEATNNKTTLKRGRGSRE